MLLLFVCSYSQYLRAEEIVVRATDDLQQVLNASENGDILLLSAGQYFGNFVITKQITLRGEGNSIIDAQGRGHGLALQRSGISIENLRIINWGNDLSENNAGIYVNNNVEISSGKQKIKDLVIKNNRLSGSGFGIWLNHATEAQVLNNIIQGNVLLGSADRGNGIHIANVSHSYIANNEVFEVRDGLYVITSQNNVVENNVMHNLRYGFHYMHSVDEVVKNNKAYSTRAGYALMSSSRLDVTGNETNDSEDYGFLLNFLTESIVSQNGIYNVWTKPENKVPGRAGKGLFFYNSRDNVLANNTIDTTEIGIHLTAGTEKIDIYGNNFINNFTPVKYVSNTKQEWSKDGRGNYWSSYLGWDMDNDGIGDAIFEPNDGIDKLIWQYPEMKVIMDSPAILILRWVQKQFPVLKPPGVRDSYPLMQPNALSHSLTKK